MLLLRKLSGILGWMNPMDFFSSLFVFIYSFIYMVWPLQTKYGPNFSLSLEYKMTQKCTIWRMCYSHWVQAVSILLRVSSPNSSNLFYFSCSVGFIRRNIDRFFPYHHNWVLNTQFLCLLFMILCLLFLVRKCLLGVHSLTHWKRRNINWYRWVILYPTRERIMLS